MYKEQSQTDVRLTPDSTSELLMMTFKSTILITGGSSGLGQATAGILANQFPDRQIIITGRSPRGVAEQINKQTGNDNVAFLSLDLSSEAGARDFAERYLASSYPPIEALVLNAALQYVDGIHTTVDGVEESFAVNHVNHSLVFFLLKSQLREDARIIIVGSTTHDPALKMIPLGAEWSSANEIAYPPTLEEKDARNEGFRRYGLSKAANTIFSLALADRATTQGKKWTVMTLDPGIMPTNLYRNQGPWMSVIFSWILSTRLMKMVYKNATDTNTVGTALAKMATDPMYAGEKVHGKYIEYTGREYPSSEVSYVKSNQQDLWDWTINKIATGDEKATFQTL